MPVFCPVRHRGVNGSSRLLCLRDDIILVLSMCVGVRMTDQVTSSSRGFATLQTVHGNLRVCSRMQSNKGDVWQRHVGVAPSEMCSFVQIFHKSVTRAAKASSVARISLFTSLKSTRDCYAQVLANSLRRLADLRRCFGGPRDP